MFTSLVGPVESLFYWPEAVLGNFYWPGAIGSLLALRPVYKKYIDIVTNVNQDTQPAGLEDTLFLCVYYFRISP